MLSQIKLKSVLYYSPITGLFTWRSCSSTRMKVGDVAGSQSAAGYIKIKIEGELYYAHRLAWLYMYGVWPTHQIDHKNGIRHDNKRSNLRQATALENQMNRAVRSNSSSGKKCVSRDAKRNKWVVQPVLGGQRYYLGRFHSVEEASLVYGEFARNHHGLFYRPDA